MSTVKTIDSSPDANCVDGQYEIRLCGMRTDFDFALGAESDPTLTP